jgi:glycosyltransferase involved in cell wall biosynthesis
VTVSQGPRPELSVVIPVLDEAATVAELHSRIRAAVGARCEVVFVDDGSAAPTREALRALAHGDPATRVFSLRRRHGKSQALALGFRRARGHLIATIDADLQDDPAELPALLARLREGFDVVVGWRRKRSDPALKVLSSRLFNVLVSAVAGVRLRDVNCGLKVFRREVLEDVALESGFHRFLPVLALWRGFRVTEVAVRHAPRRHGRSRYGTARGLRGFLDLWVILFLMRFGGRPGRFFLGAGTLLGIAGAGISVYIAILKLVTGTIQSRYPLMALGLVLLVVGFQLVSLGLFGELLAYHSRNLRPVEPIADELEAERDRASR